MLLWAALALLAVAVGLVARWLLRPRDGLGRPKPFPVASCWCRSYATTGWSSG